MRHPPTWLYVVAFGSPILVGVLGGIKVWNSSYADTSLMMLVAKTAIAVVVPLGSVLMALALFAAIMIYLGTFRRGNRILITDGDHAGKHAVVTQRHGLTTPGWVHVHISEDGDDATISPYQLRKVGWRSHVF